MIALSCAVENNRVRGRILFLLNMCQFKYIIIINTFANEIIWLVNHHFFNRVQFNFDLNFYYFKSV